MKDLNAQPFMASENDPATISAILDLVPDMDGRTLLLPLYGSGNLHMVLTAAFYNAGVGLPFQVLANEYHLPLAQAYETLKSHPAAVLVEIKSMFQRLKTDGEDYFVAERKMAAGEMASKDFAYRAARLIFLIWNSKGKILSLTPDGRFSGEFEATDPPSEQGLIDLSRLLQGKIDDGVNVPVTILSSTYNTMMELADSASVTIIEPPQHFTGKKGQKRPVDGGSFRGWTDEYYSGLVLALDYVNDVGGKFILTGSNDNFTKDKFKKWTQKELKKSKSLIITNI